jgi:hypothetical protein
MTLLYFIADTFIDTFGITRPSENARKRAALFILFLIVLAVAIASAAGLIVLKVLH